jgi:HSP20 family protein
MATQSSKGNEQQGQQAQSITRGSGEPSPTRRGFGSWLSPAHFFRTDPMSLIRRMTEEFDRMWDQDRESSGRTWAPAVEVQQRDNELVVQAELPGLKPEDVKLEIGEDSLVIQGESKSEQEQTKGGMRMSERRYGSFYRSIPLPEGAKVEEAKAQFKNGVLEITVPTEEPRSNRRQIPIQGATQTGGTPEKTKAA